MFGEVMSIGVPIVLVIGWYTWVKVMTKDRNNKVPRCIDCENFREGDSKCLIRLEHIRSERGYTYEHCGPRGKWFRPKEGK
jgi:hypothetical protein